MSDIIQWFPGHMAKARRQVEEQLPLVDVVVEVVDARAPRATTNPDLAVLAARRPRVAVLNKADLAAPAATRAWVEHHRAAGMVAVPLDAVSGRGAQDVVAAVRRLFAPELERLRGRGRLPRAARAMVVGMPNVGKSALINRLTGGRRAAVGDRPGITRGPQWVRVGKDVDLLDTPGILVPRVATRETGILLAALGSVRAEVFDPEMVAGHMLPILHRLAPSPLQERYGLADLDPEPGVNLEQVARHRGMLLAGGVPDPARAAALLLREMREGRLGRLTFELPGDNPAAAMPP